jgi:CRP/FNR family transcriptional regulator
MGLTGVIGTDPKAEEAWKNSFLADLPEPLTSHLLEDSTRVRMDATELIFRRALHPGSAGLFLIVDGLVRVYLVGPDGRQATVRYADHSEIIGLPPLLVAGLGTWAEAVTEVEAIRLSSSRFVSLAQKHVELAWTTALFVAGQLASTSDVLAADIFLPVRARIARHLLDLAQRRPVGLFVPARHQQLADAVGSVREVVSREMRRFGDEGLVRRLDGGVILDDPAGLHRISIAPRGKQVDPKDATD